MKKLFISLLALFSLAASLQSMEEKISEQEVSKKRKREHSAQEVQIDKQLKTSETEFLDLPLELQELILLTALDSSPSKALKTLKALEQVNKDLYSWARNHAKKSAHTWVKENPHQASEIFVKTAQAGDNHIFDALIKAKINIDSPNSKKYTAIRSATEAGHADMVSKLVESGAIINSSSLLAINERFDIARILLATGGAVLAKHPLGTELICAVLAGQKKRVKKILKKGIHVDNPDHYGMTALLYAAANGNREMVKLLLKKGANANYLHVKLRCTPLLIAVSNAKQAVVELLLAAGAIVDRDDANSPIQRARQQGYTEIESLLIEASNIQNSPPGYREFATACQHKDTTFIANFINALTDRHQELTKLLFFAIKTGNKTVVKQLIQYNTDIDCFGPDGKSALSAAVCHGHYEMVKQLLKNGARNIVQDNNTEKKTPLIHAISKNHPQIAHLLMDHGSPHVTMTHHTGYTERIYQVAVADGRDSTPLDYAITIGNRDLVARILDQRVIGIRFIYETSLVTAARLGYTEIVQLLFDRNFLAPDGSSDSEGTTPLMAAASRGHTQTLQLLLTRFAPYVNQHDHTKHTPLMYAARYGHRAAVELLLAYNANPDLRNMHGLTALDFATQHGHHDIASMLEKHILN